MHSGMELIKEGIELKSWSHYGSWNSYSLDQLVGSINPNATKSRGEFAGTSAKGNHVYGWRDTYSQA